MHFAYWMKGSDPNPVFKTTPTRDWFLHYKWFGAGFVWVPCPTSGPKVQAGDTLWFVLDGRVLGCACIDRTREDASYDRVELWYGQHVVVLPKSFWDVRQMIWQRLFGSGLVRPISKEVARRWLERS